MGTFLFDTNGVRGVGRTVLKSTRAAGHTLLLSPVSFWELVCHLNDPDPRKATAARNNALKADLFDVLDDPLAEIAADLGCREGANPSRFVDRQVVPALVAALKTSASYQDLCQQPAPGAGAGATIGDFAANMAALLQREEQQFVGAMKQRCAQFVQDYGRSVAMHLAGEAFCRAAVGLAHGLRDDFQACGRAVPFAEIANRTLLGAGYAVARACEYIKNIPAGAPLAIDGNDFEDYFICLHLGASGGRTIVTDDRGTRRAIERVISTFQEFGERCGALFTTNVAVMATEEFKRTVAATQEQPRAAMTQPYEQPRFVGFVDVLGYKAIVLGEQFTEAARFHYLHSAFEALAAAAHQVIADLGGPPRLRAIQFSDSFYFSSSSAVTLVTAVSQFFATVLTYYDHVFEEVVPADAQHAFHEWTPFLRAGIVHDWFFDGHDITLPGLQNPADAFRNPIGPAVAKAYLLGEQTRMEGMRIGVTTAVRDQFEQELPTVGPASYLGIMAAPLHPIFLTNHPTFGAIFEVPWFESKLQTNNLVGTFDVLLSAERQFDPAAMKHYRGTWDAVLRTPGVQANEVLRAHAAGIRHDVVSRMAYANWQRRGQPPRDPWYDWFVAEGLV